MVGTLIITLQEAFQAIPLSPLFPSESFEAAFKKFPIRPHVAVLHAATSGYRARNSVERLLQMQKIFSRGGHGP